MVIDNGIVITGSFNFTQAAQKDNAENVLIIKDEKLAKGYKANLETHLQHSERSVPITETAHLSLMRSNACRSLLTPNQ